MATSALSLALRSVGPGEPASALVDWLGGPPRVERARTLLVAYADVAPDQIAAEIEGLRIAAPELVLLHRGRGRPRATRRRREAAGATRVHHLRLGVAEDRGAFVRALSGASVTLVLSGGGARGLAHIGVIQALREAGVPIDAVGGSSAGGGVGVLLAGGFTPDAMVRSITDAWVDSGVFRRVAARPRRGLLDPTPLRERVEAWLGGLEFEDLWRDCFVVAANSSRRRREILDSGSLVTGVLATCAIPGLLPPVEVDGDLLVDGGVVDNLPVEVMLARRPGFVIASDVRLAGRFGSGRRVATPASERPRQPSTLVGLVGAAARTWARSSSAAPREAIGALLRPSLPSTALLSFRDPAPIVEAGYRCAVAAIEAGALDPALRLLS